MREGYSRNIYITLRRARLSARVAEAFLPYVCEDGHRSVSLTICTRALYHVCTFQELLPAVLDHGRGLYQIYAE